MITQCFTAHPSSQTHNHDPTISNLGLQLSNPTRQDPTFAPAAYARGACQNRMGNFDDAINDYTLALERDQVRAESMYIYTCIGALSSIDARFHRRLGPFLRLRGTVSNIHSKMPSLFHFWLKFARETGGHGAPIALALAKGKSAIGCGCGAVSRREAPEPFSRQAVCNQGGQGVRKGWFDREGESGRR